MNKELLNKFYETIFDNEPAFKESCRKIDNAVREIEGSYSMTLQKEAVEQLSNDFVNIISDAHHDGFEIGMKFAFQLIAEMILD